MRDGEESVVWCRARRSVCRFLLGLLVGWKGDEKGREGGVQGVFENGGCRCSCCVVVCYLDHGFVEVLDDAVNLFCCIC